MICCVHDCEVPNARARVGDLTVTYVVCEFHREWALRYLNAGTSRSMLARPPRPGCGVPQQHGPQLPRPGGL